MLLACIKGLFIGKMMLKQALAFTSIFLLHVSLYADTYPLIETLEVTKRTITITPGEHFKAAFLNDDFYIEYFDEGIDLREHDSSILIMPFLFDVLSTVLSSGDTYFVERLDATVCASIEEIAGRWKRQFNDIKWDGRLICKTAVQNSIDFLPDRVMVLCGGGVDSTYTTIKYLGKEQVLFALKGHVDSSSTEQWLQVQHTLKAFQTAFHHETSLAYSQSPYIIRCDYPWRAKTIGNLRMIGKAIPLLVHYRTPCLLAPSTITWEHPFPYHSPHVDGAVRFGNGIVVAQDGVECSRCEKVDTILNALSERGIQEWPLKVCLQSKSGINCNSCNKCLKTMNDLAICGADPNKFGFTTSTQEIKELLIRSMETLNALIGVYNIEEQLHLASLHESLKYIEREGRTEQNEYTQWFYKFMVAQPCIDYIKSLPPQAAFID